jgi:hypothetical protein
MRALLNPIDTIGGKRNYSEFRRSPDKTFSGDTLVMKRFVIAAALLFLAQTTFAQFNQLNRLTDLAGQLSRDAENFADANYRSYANSPRSSRSDVEAVMLSQQFAGASRIFYRMTVDRRRNQDLRDAYGFLQDLARSVDRTNAQRNSWYDIQRLLSDIGTAMDAPGGGHDNYPDQARGGRMTWKGRVDDDVRITVRGGRADVETIGGTAYYDGQPNFFNSLPSRRVNVSLNMKKGRGQIYIEQQPSRDNDFAVVVRIKDPKGGASDYEFELIW